jgi:hypothetical protein
MKFDNEKLGCSFEIPDKPTVRQQLAYNWIIATENEADGMGKHWRAAQPLITGWKCETLPDVKVNLDTVTDTAITTIISWAALSVFQRMTSLEDIPPNS